MGQYRKPLTLSILMLAAAAVNAQNVERAYNRDTQESFKLKDVVSKSVVKGPIVKQDTIFRYENPYQKLTEASVWFDFPYATILSGFGYWFKDEYVPGILMDKNKAWFIYTAITSRNEDPGIMVQTSPSSYHTQIYPLAVGHDLRVRLTSVGFLQAEDGRLVVPNPSVEEQEYPTTVTSAQPDTLKEIKEADSLETVVEYPTDPGMDMLVYAQRHKDGYTYVAGILRTDKPNAALDMRGLHRVYWTRPEGAEDGSVKMFIGRRRGAGTIQIRAKDEGADYTKKKYIKANERGSDAAKLWAHQRLQQDDWTRNRDVLKFSLQYQIPSSQTALLAVPQEQMRLFKKKAAEYRKEQARQARLERQWQRDRQQNWSRSSGGDPEIRVFLPNAERVYAVLPDGRTFDLVKSRSGFWGGNYDIPANAPEGSYDVRVVSIDRDGNQNEQTVSYQVDRTAPTGELKIEDEFLVLTSEEGLAKAIVVFGDGTEEPMIEVTPGVYKLPVGKKRIVKVVLIDKAHNIADLPWSR